MEDYLILLFLFLIWLDNSRAGARLVVLGHNAMAKIRHKLNGLRKPKTGV